MIVQVRNLVSYAGNFVPNQFEITVGHKIYFQSYGTVIAMYNQRNHRMYLDKDAWDYSTTTGKYRNIWLGEKRAETERKIKNGTYKLRNLNK